MKNLIFFLSTFALCCTNLVSFAITDTLNLGKIYFKTEQTWKIGQQEWSDVVMATGCEKEDYGELVDCYRDSIQGDLFSWEVVNRYKTQFCPMPWRVPTLDDFVNLDKALGGTGMNRKNDEVFRDKYLHDWGGTYGYYLQDNQLVKCAYYWSLSEGSLVSAYRLSFNENGDVLPRAGSYKDYAHSLRCVR